MEVFEIKRRHLHKKENYLDYIPVHNAAYTYTKNKRGLIIIRVPNTGWINRVAQRFFGMPEVSTIRLDTYGSYVWEQIDGKRDVQDLACVMKERFGQKAEPLYERLIRFIETLRENKYIHLNKDGEETQKAGSASKQCCREA